MRHQYTPIFREITTSSIWTTSPSTRCVWFWLLLHADPEGYVPGAPGAIAHAANVSEDEGRRAIQLFLEPDPDSRNAGHEGRRLERVPGGFRILNFEYYRKLASQEADKARKRRWAEAQGKNPKQLELPFPPSTLDPERCDHGGGARWISTAAGEVTCAECGLTTTVGDATRRTLDAPKPKPISKPEDQIPAAPGFEAAQGQRLRYFNLDGWEMSDELRQKAIAVGVPREDIDRRVAELRNGPIGGSRGVFDRDKYVEQRFGQWRTWAETERAKASAKGYQRPEDTPPAPKRLPGLPAWVDEKHAAFARQHGIDLKEGAKGFASTYHMRVSGLRRADLFEPFMKFLEGYAHQESA